MKITKSSLQQITEIANSNNVEFGGILGSDDEQTISYIVSDLPDSVAICRFNYYPNIDFLNKQIEAWANKNVIFMGIFHTHFSGSKNLSEADKEYIKKIMIYSKGIVEYLYFPIFTLPDNELNVYKAYFKDEKVFIEKDELAVI